VNWYYKFSSEKKTLYILVGPPSVGKSTWIKNNFPDAFVISRDDIVNEVASELGLTYDDLFDSPDQSLEIGHTDSKFGTVIERPPYLPKFLPEKVWDKITTANGDIHKRFLQRIQDAKTSGNDVIVDMTNMNARSRENMLKTFNDYHKTAVDFNFQGKGVLDAIKEISRRRAEEIKEKGGSKTIPDHVFDSMVSRYEEPSISEGFDEVIKVDDRERILSIVPKIGFSSVWLNKFSNKSPNKFNISPRWPSWVKNMISQWVKIGIIKELTKGHAFVLTTDTGYTYQGHVTQKDRDCMNIFSEIYKNSLIKLSEEQIKKVGNGKFQDQLRHEKIEADDDNKDYWSRKFSKRITNDEYSDEEIITNFLRTLEMPQDKKLYDYSIILKSLSSKNRKKIISTIVEYLLKDKNFLLNDLSDPNNKYGKIIEIFKSEEIFEPENFHPIKTLVNKNFLDLKDNRYSSEDKLLNDLKLMVNDIEEYIELFEEDKEGIIKLINAYNDYCDSFGKIINNLKFLNTDKLFKSWIEHSNSEIDKEFSDLKKNLEEANEIVKKLDEFLKSQDFSKDSSTFSFNSWYYKYSKIIQLNNFRKILTDRLI
jgi:ferritin